MKQLNPLDASFYYRETPTEYQHISGFGIYDPSTVPDRFKQSNGEVLGFKDLLRFMEKGLEISPVARRKLVPVPGNLDHPYWVNDSDFDLEYHIRHLALPKPGDWQQLCIMIARLHSRPLDMTRPLWELYVIEGLDNIPGLPEGCFAIFSKTHHAAIDGASGAHLASATHTLDPNDDVVLPEDIEPWEPEEMPTHEQLLMRTHFRSLQKPLEAYELYTNHLPKLVEAQTKMAKRGYKAPRAVPQTRFNGAVTSQRVFDGRAFDLDEFKAIRRKQESTTINDVVLSIVGGAWRKYMTSIDELPEESLVALVPINVRTEADADGEGNLVSGMTAPIGSDIEDPLQRLAFVSQETRESKEMTNAIGARAMMEFRGLTPAAMAALGARAASAHAADDAHVNPTNMTITNVPGVQQPIYLSGARAMVSFGLGPIENGCGVFISAQSYAGLITISITSDRKMLEYPERFAEFLDESFLELKSAVLGEASATENPIVNATSPRGGVRSTASSKAKPARRVSAKSTPRKAKSSESSARTKAAATQAKSAPTKKQPAKRKASPKSQSKPAAKRTNSRSAKAASSKAAPKSRSTKAPASTTSKSSAAKSRSTTRTTKPASAKAAVKKRPAKSTAK